MNGFDIQTEADAMLERQGREVTPRLIGAGPSSTKIVRSSSRCDLVCIVFVFCAILFFISLGFRNIDFKFV